MSHTQYRLGAVLLLLAVGAIAAEPEMNDFAQGMRMRAPSDRPVIEITLPDDVYRTVTRTDLGDVRVFNAGGMPVPHAFCAAPQTGEPTIAQQPLPVFDVHGMSPQSRDTRVEVQTSGGVAVNVRQGERESEASSLQTQAHVIDARVVSYPLRAVQFEWESPDGASEAHVRIEASEDLDRWDTVVGTTTLLQLTRGGDALLQRQRVDLPQRPYKYLRVVRTDRGPPLRITAVVAESVAPAKSIEPLWFAADAVSTDETKVMLFDSGRLAPISHARLTLPQENTSLRIRVESRSDERTPWRLRWAGEVYSVVTVGERRSSAPAEFSPTTDRYWKITPANPGGLFTDTAKLELGYRPARLRFLYQGAGPFTLAFGSRRAEPAARQACGALLGDVDSRDLAQMMGDASLVAPKVLGGEAALSPLPEKTPARVVVLWVVLVAGVALLAAMAVSLLRRVNTPSGAA